MCDLMTRLSRLSSAEDFLAFFSVPFEQRFVDVNRLHIMKRFGLALSGLDWADGDEKAVIARARKALVDACREIEGSGPRGAGLFKVFQPPPAPTADSCSGSCSGGRCGGHGVTFVPGLPG